jgi:hypothetical protein
MKITRNDEVTPATASIDDDEGVTDIQSVSVLKGMHIQFFVNRPATTDHPESLRSPVPFRRFRWHFLGLA